MKALRRLCSNPTCYLQAYEIILRDVRCGWNACIGMMNSLLLWYIQIQAETGLCSLIYVVTCTYLLFDKKNIAKMIQKCQHGATSCQKYATYWCCCPHSCHCFTCISSGIYVLQPKWGKHPSMLGFVTQTMGQNSSFQYMFLNTSRYPSVYIYRIISDGNPQRGIQLLRVST